jgi:hypothetical protein
MGRPAARAMNQAAEISAAARPAPSPALLRERVFERYAGCCIRSARRLAMVGAFAAFSGF